MSRSIPTEDYYETLGLSQNCTEDDIKRAYRQFSVLVHPDKHMNESPELQIVAETVFKILNNAHETLADKPSRRTYDSDFYPGIQRTRLGAPRQNAFDLFTALKAEIPRQRSGNSQQHRNRSQENYAQNTKGTERSRRQRPDQRRQQQQAADREDEERRARTERVRRARQRAEADARERWRQDLEKRKMEKEANEAEEREAEAARQRAEADSRERKSKEERRQADEEAKELREKRSRMTRRWKEVSQPLTDEVLKIWVKIDAIRDMLASMSAKYTLEPVSDWATLEQDESMRNEHEYRDRQAKMAVKRANAYWKQIEKIEFRRYELWYREIYEKEGLTSGDRLLFSDEWNYNKRERCKRQNVMQMEWDKQASKRLQNEAMEARYREARVKRRQEQDIKTKLWQRKPVLVVFQDEVMFWASSLPVLAAIFGIEYLRCRWVNCIIAWVAACTVITLILVKISRFKGEAAARD